MFNPSFGIEKMGRDLGLDWFRFDWIVRQDMVIYTLVFAAVWHAAGLVMAIMLAGLRGIDEDIWKAARIDGTAAVAGLSLDRHPDAGRELRHRLGAARDQRGAALRPLGRDDQWRPGHASEVPAKFVMDHLFERGNLGLATAAATSMLITVAAVVAPWLYWQSRARDGRSPA